MKKENSHTQVIRMLAGRQLHVVKKRLHGKQSVRTDFRVPYLQFFIPDGLKTSHLSCFLMVLDPFASIRQRMVSGDPALLSLIPTCCTDP